MAKLYTQRLHHQTLSSQGFLADPYRHPSIRSYVVTRYLLHLACMCRIAPVKISDFCSGHHLPQVWSNSWQFKKIEDLSICSRVHAGAAHLCIHDGAPLSRQSEGAHATLTFQPDPSCLPCLAACDMQILISQNRMKGSA